MEAAFEILAMDVRLSLKRETDPSPIVMLPGSGPNDFRVRGMTIRFETGVLTVDAGRVRGIHFVRRD